MKCHFVTLVAFTAFVPILVVAQTKVNVLVLYDDGYNLARKSIETAIKYLKDNPTQGVSVANSYFKGLKDGHDVEATVNETCEIYDEAVANDQAPHIILDATRTGLMSETMKSFSRALALPTFSASYGQEGDLREWRDASSDELNYLVQVMPPGDIIVQAVRDFSIKQNLSNAAILYGADSVVMDHKYKSLLQNVPCRHIILVAETSSSALREQLKKMKNADIVNFFVIGNLDIIRKVLSAATAQNLFGRKYSWYAISKETGNMGCGCDNASIIFLKPQTTSNIRSRIDMLKGSYKLDETPAVDAAFYFDFGIRGIKATGSMVSKGNYKDFKYVKCSTFDDQNPPIRKNFNYRSALKQVNMQDTWGKINWSKEDTNGESFPMISMSVNKVKVMKGKVASSNDIGVWEPNLPDGKIMVKAGQNIKDHQAVTVYKITTVVQPPFVMKRKDKDGKEEFYGYCIDLINEIKALNKFEYELYEAPDKKFGTMNENMEWNGLIRELIDKKAEIALAPISVMAERENVVDFTVPYYDLVGITILMTKPKVPTSLFKFLTVLEPEVWICILAAYGFTSLLLWIFDRFSPYSYQNNKEVYKDDDEKREFNFKECLWFCMTSLTPQGGGEAPKNLSGRLVAATWWLFGFIIIASYTANLAAFLTVSRLDTPIESLTDLSNQYKVQYSPMNGSATMTYFERMAYIEKKFYEIWKDMSLNDTMDVVERAKLAVWDYPVSDKYTKMWQSIQEAGLPATFGEALERVRSSKSSSEGYAYLGDATDIKYQVLTNCDLQQVGEEFSRKPYAVAVQQGSPLKDQFNDAILKLLNQRKLETLKERWWNQNPEKKVCETENDQSDGISIENIGGVFIVIFVGIALACITLAFEYWWYKYRKGSRITDSARVVSVKEFPNGKDNKTFTPEKSNFNTEYKSDGYDLAPVPSPW